MCNYYMYFTNIEPYAIINSTKENKRNKSKEIQIKERRRTHMIKVISEFLSAYYGEFAHREAK